MRKALVALGLVLLTGMLYVSIASANGGPHGDYIADGLTDKCAGCHRVHQGISDGFLLKADNPYDLCLTCHNGAGSQLDVLDGVKLASWQSRTPGQTGLAALNGGGFEYINGTAVTSKHNADPAENSLAPWGYGGSGQGNFASGGTPGGASAVNTGANSNQLDNALECVSCHDPHGSPNYRILKNVINDNPVSVEAWWNGSLSKDEGARGLEAGAPADKYTKDYYGSSGSNATGSFGNFCGACHTAYPSDDGATGMTAPMTPGGPTTVHYRHLTEQSYTLWADVASTDYNFPVKNPETDSTRPMPWVTLRLASSTTTGANTVVVCLTCHRVHGTTAQMSGWALSQTVDASGKSVEQISPAQTAVSTSTLLYTNNRGMCEACHQWPN